MMKVSSFFVLCGLLASSSALLTQLGNAVAHGLLNQGLQAADLLGSVSGSLGLSGSLLGLSAGAKVQVSSIEILRTVLESSSREKEAYLRVPMSVGVSGRILNLGSVALNVQAEVRLQIRVEQGLGDRYQLVFGQCGIVDDSIRFQNTDPTTQIPGFLLESVQNVLRNTVLNNVSEKVCLLINNKLSNLDQSFVDTLINNILLHKNFQINI